MQPDQYPESVFADKACEHWPPPKWKEGDLYRDKLTRLPTQLYPFVLHRREDGLQLRFEGKRGIMHDVGEPEPDIWTAHASMIAHYRAWFDRQQPCTSEGLSKVYFIGSELKIGRPVKVGVSIHPEARLKSLQTGHPERLQIFATTPGGVDMERKYHRRWQTRRQKGEWFTLGACIINEINRLALSTQHEGGA